MLDFETEFREIANDDAAAYDFLRAVFEFVHCWDDLFDKDKPVTADLAGLTLIKLIATLTTNEFYRRHAAPLLQALHAACFGWMASERLKSSDDLQNKVASEVLKSSYIEIFFVVAFLVGGTKHQLEMDRKYRGYSFG